jgi:hypothetical protein
MLFRLKCDVLFGSRAVDRVQVWSNNIREHAVDLMQQDNQ